MVGAFLDRRSSTPPGSPWQVKENTINGYRYVDLMLYPADNMNRKFSQPYFLFLLPLFFVSHVCTENPGLVSFKLAAFMFLEFSAITLAFSLLFTPVTKSFRKAAIAGFFLVAFHVFFGSFQDLVNRDLPNAWFMKYSVLITVVLLLLIVLLVYLRKTRKELLRFCIFLNLLFGIFAATDLFKLTVASTQKKPAPVAKLDDAFTKCDTCSRPDIYLLLADGYPGDTVLKNYFEYDNSPFLDRLKETGFHIVKDPVANYNFTVYTLASMFNMDYIQGLNKEKMVTQQDIYLCRDLIENSNFTRFLKLHGYEIRNFSFMNVGGSNSKIRLAYFPPKRALFTSQTFLNRFFKNAGFNFPSLGRIFYRNIKSAARNNKVMDSLTQHSLTESTGKPRFTFTHLLLPHHPYYYDSTGQLINPEGRLFYGEEEKKRMREYLRYSNKKLLSLVDTILARSPKPPIILLMSDHGYRNFPVKDLDNLQFLTLNAVYIPGSDYHGFYDGMSTVNQLRVLLSNQFSQKLPVLKDSTSFIIEP